MFDNMMICEDGFENVAEGGETIGFRFRARLPYYRGLGLSMIEDVQVAIDGETMPRETIRLSLRGRSWSLTEMESEHDDRWNFGEKAEILVLKAGGLASGEHRIDLAERLRISYLPFVPTTKSSKALTLA